MAIFTSSMTCSRGLLGFPDLVALGLISREWVTKDHLCKAKVTVGALGLPRKCENSTTMRGSKRPMNGGESVVPKRLKLSEAPPSSLQSNSIKIFNISKYDANKSVKFQGDMTEFFEKEVERLRVKYSDILGDSIP